MLLGIIGLTLTTLLVKVVRIYVAARIRHAKPLKCLILRCAGLNQ